MTQTTYHGSNAARSAHAAALLQSFQAADPSSRSAAVNGAAPRGDEATAAGGAGQGEVFASWAERGGQTSSPFLLGATRLMKSYRKGKHVIPVLRGVDFSVRAGEFVAVVGQSGSGKSTLLHLLGTLDSPDAGEVHFEGNRIDNLPPQARDVLRNRYFGMIFQFYHLLPELSTLENVLVPAMIGQSVLRYFWNRRQHRLQAERLLDMVGLSHRLTHRPKELSGGEMQRAAIARALVAGPQLLLADEPTGNLDRKTGADIMRLLRTLNRDQNLTIIMVTHDSTIAGMADRTVRLVEGLVERVS